MLRNNPRIYPGVQYNDQYPIDAILSYVYPYPILCLSHPMSIPSYPPSYQCPMLSRKTIPQSMPSFNLPPLGSSLVLSASVDFVTVVQLLFGIVVPRRRCQRGRVPCASILEYAICGVLYVHACMS